MERDYDYHSDYGSGRHRDDRDRGEDRRRGQRQGEPWGASRHEQQRGYDDDYAQYGGGRWAQQDGSRHEEAQYRRPGWAGGQQRGDFSEEYRGNRGPQSRYEAEESYGQERGRRPYQGQGHEEDRWTASRTESGFGYGGGGRPYQMREDVRDFGPRHDQGRSYGYGEGRAYGAGGRQYGAGAQSYQGYGQAYGRGDEGRQQYGQQYGTYEGSHRGKGPRNYSRSDDRITDDVNERMTSDGDLDAREIDVKVQKGEVTLTGTVDSKMAKRRAEDCADSVMGVKHVQNNLRLSDDASGSDVRSASSSQQIGDTGKAG